MVLNVGHFAGLGMGYVPKRHADSAPRRVPKRHICFVTPCPCKLTGSVDTPFRFHSDKLSRLRATVRIERASSYCGVGSLAEGGRTAPRLRGRLALVRRRRQVGRINVALSSGRGLQVKACTWRPHCLVAQTCDNPQPQTGRLPPMPGRRHSPPVAQSVPPSWKPRLLTTAR
jgi:hypothetical protein